MQDLKPEIDEKTYLAGTPLNEALFKYGNPESIQNYKSSANGDYIRSKPQKTPSLMDVLSFASQAIQDIQTQQDKKKEALIVIQKEIFLLIQNGDLIPYSYQSPRKLSDLPKRVPIDMILSGQLNWDNSELIYKDFEFTGIRLINAQKEISEIKSDINSANNNQIPEIPNNSKIKTIPKSKNNFEDLDPQQFIDEKIAAEFLGISPRTLQGYRTKGGGPEFHKISHKVVRYKIAELIKWTNNKKKKNTSDRY